MEKIQIFLKRNKLLKYGVPFVLLVVGGSFGLKEFSQLRYTYSKKQSLKPEDVAKYGIKMKHSGEVTLESEYEKIKEIDIDHWENIRGPRPWENNTPLNSKA